MKELKEYDVDNLPFSDILSSRYMISAKLDAEKLWKYSKTNNKSFFILTLGCILNAVNKVPPLKRRIIDDKVIEYDYLDGVCPIMDEEKRIFREIRVEVPQKFKNFDEWYDYVYNLKEEVIYDESKAFDMELSKRDTTNIVNCSCIPWIDFEAITNAVVEGNSIQPLITWGKVNDNYKMTVSITVSHIFVFGRDLGYFYEYLQDNLNMK